MQYFIFVNRIKKFENRAILPRKSKRKRETHMTLLR